MNDKGGIKMNPTIQTILNHRSIRKFKNKKLDSSTVSTLIDAARHTSSSNFMQSYSIISVNEPSLKQKIAAICNQDYVAESGHLFIMLVDQHRNQTIAKENGVNTDVLHSMDRFLVGVSDALLASQNIMIAAESMGLGGVFLGSILNEADQIIDLLQLPKLTFPILGIALGYPDQNPQLKPRLPKDMMHFKDRYPVYENLNEKLKDYDEIVHQYYDLRDANRRVDYFTKQISDGMNRKHPGRMKLLQHIQKQGFMLY